MAIFGRESAADRARVERVRLFVQSRSPWALLSAMAGLLSVLDFFTLVLGLPLAIGAIVLGLAGLGDLKRRPGLGGRGLCIAGIVLGGLGLLLGAFFFLRVVVGRAG